MAVQDAESKSMKLLKSTKRDFQVITEPAKIRYILEEHTGYRNLWIKSTVPPAEAVYASADPETNQITFQVSPGLQVGEAFSLYCTLSKHLEFDFETIECTGDGKLTGRLARARIANAAREAKRFVLTEGVAMAKKFAVSKNKIDLNPHTPLVSNKIIFKEYERKLSMKYPGAQVLDHGIDNEDPASKLLKKTEKPVLVTDLTSKESYFVKDPNLAEYGPAVESTVDDFNKLLYKARDNGETSLLCVPIIYQNLADERFSIGYIRVVSKGKVLGAADLATLSKEAEEIVEKIKDANTVLIDTPQTIQNISMRGAAIIINDEQLIQFIVQRESFVLDFVFKMQAPLRLYCKICYIIEGENDGTRQMIVGVSFAGKAFNQARTTLEMLLGTLGV